MSFNPLPSRNNSDGPMKELLRRHLWEWMLKSIVHHESSKGMG